MELETKPDFERALERMEAWWDGGIIDRPPVTLHVRSDADVARPQKDHADLRDAWMDVEYQVDRAEAAVTAGVYFAENFPRYMPNLGPEICATVFGCDLEFGERTSWSLPSARSCREIVSRRPDYENVYWQAIREMTDLSIERGRGRWITAMPDLHMDGDLLASLRDPQELCIDLVEDPTAVRAACDHVTEFYPALFDDIWSRIAAADQPCTTWLPYMHAKRAYATSCDFSCMISPEMFQETILPAIRREMRWLDRNIYHLDGPDALKHLDALLACEDLDAVQWVYGAGNGPAAKWIDVYRRIQAAGKGMQLAGESFEDCRTVAEQLRPEGVWLCPGGAHSREEAEAFVAWADRWAAGKA